MNSGQGARTTAAPCGVEMFRNLEQSALDAIPTALCVCAADATLICYNRRAAELWGRAPRIGDKSESFGGGFARFQPDGNVLPFTETPVARALRTGERVLGAEVGIERPDGSRVSVLMNVAPLKSATGGVTG
ncbi:MAG TPA: hypothetical protein VJ779_15210, partial [Acetobacteraceae bacterium]|nr:hypothetical protein [Acetobacteraceae bacterium]